VHQGSSPPSAAREFSSFPMTNTSSDRVTVATDQQQSSPLQDVNVVQDSRSLLPSVAAVGGLTTANVRPPQQRLDSRGLSTDMAPMTTLPTSPNLSPLNLLPTATVSAQTREYSSQGPATPRVAVVGPFISEGSEAETETLPKVCSSSNEEIDETMLKSVVQQNNTGSSSSPVSAGNASSLASPAVAACPAQRPTQSVRYGRQHGVLVSSTDQLAEACVGSSPMSFGSPPALSHSRSSQSITPGFHPPNESRLSSRNIHSVPSGLNDGGFGIRARPPSTASGSESRNNCIIS
jgi:hypothetical protein